MRRLILACLVSGCAQWSHGDTAREALFATQLVVDDTQTVTLTHDCVENNPIIGRCGGHVPIHAYFAVTGLLHWGISAVLPPRYRLAWQYLTLGVEGGTIVNNAITSSHF